MMTLLVGDGEFREGCFAFLGDLDAQSLEVHMQGSIRPKHPKVIGTQSGDLANSHVQDRSGVHFGDDLHVVGRGDRTEMAGARVASGLDVGASEGGDAGCRAHPSGHCLVPNAHEHDVHAVQVAIVPPEEWQVWADEGSLHPLGRVECGDGEVYG